MYYARGGPSFNVSTKGGGNAVLIKSACVYGSDTKMIEVMQNLNPLPGPRVRSIKGLCAGQTLLCKSLGLKVTDWDQQQFDPARFYCEDVGTKVRNILQLTRRGIPKGRDEHLLYRFVWCDDERIG